MTVSIRSALAEGAGVLATNGVTEPRLEASSLLAHTTSRDRAFIITHADDVLPPVQLETFRFLIARRAAGEPLQYLTGHQEFFKLDFEVTRDVLIPRPETELVVETSLELLRDQHKPLIADIGTGSGCIAVSLLHELPNAKAVATDTSTAALEVARRNAERHGISGRLTFIESDCLEGLSGQQQFTLIVSNPPYVSDKEMQHLQREVRFEPRAALAGGPDGLSIIRRLLRGAPKFLRAGGHLVFEFGFGQEELLRKLIDTERWRLLEIQKDLQKISRSMVLQKR